MQPLELPRGPLRLFTFNATDTAQTLKAAAGLSEDAYVTDGVLQVLTNAAYLGDKDTQSFELLAGSSMPFDFLAVDELWVKNKTPGSNAAIRVLAFIGRRRM